MAPKKAEDQGDRDLTPGVEVSDSIDDLTVSSVITGFVVLLSSLYGEQKTPQKDL